MCSVPDGRNFLAFDLSTQQLKLLVVDESLNRLYDAKVDFDSELPEFRTKGGVIRSNDGQTVCAPVLMWVKAVDLAMDKIRVAGCDFSEVVGISGCAQQHGSVYWKTGSSKLMGSLDSGKFLHTQLATAFSLLDSPVWMDSSTTPYCKALEEAFGGPEALAGVTGSRAYERFTGNQIAKVYDAKPEIYFATERISLVSSFLASLLIGDYAPIDVSDGSGMNLLDVNKKKWSLKALDAVAPELALKLGDPVGNFTVLGNISPYFVNRYGFGENCKIISFTGDNPASLAGMNLGLGEMAISLGTSDTVFLSLVEADGGLLGHVLCNPVTPDAFMGLLCFKNGSLTRERIKNVHAQKSWDKFCELLRSTEPGNHGYVGLYYDLPEILPSILGDFRFDPDGNLIARFPKPDMEVRACIEGQVMRLRSFSEKLGFTSGTSILVTGGASTNADILQIIADVFNTPVYTLDVPDSANLGAAYITAYTLQEDENKPSFYEFVKNLIGQSRNLVCQPVENSSKVYEGLMAKYRECEAKAVDIFAQSSR